MKRLYERLLFVLALLSALGGFVGDPEHIVFWWHRIPFLGALVGGFGAVLLMGVIKGVASFAAKKEDFYD